MTTISSPWEADSLAASELIFAIEEEFGVELRLSDLLVAPTIEELANLVVRQREEGAVGSRCV